MPSGESTVRRRLLDTHRETLDSVVRVGQAVANSWSGDVITDSSAVRGPLEDAIAMEALDRELLRMLSVGADSLDTEISGDPIPAPPYLVVTSRGPVCRATLSSDQRLVLLLELFGVDRPEATYRFLDPGPTDCLSVSLR